MPRNERNGTADPTPNPAPAPAATPKAAQPTEPANQKESPRDAYERLKATYARENESFKKFCDEGLAEIDRAAAKLDEQRKRFDVDRAGRVERLCQLRWAMARLEAESAARNQPLVEPVRSTLDLVQTEFLDPRRTRKEVADTDTIAQPTEIPAAPVAADAETPSPAVFG